MKRYEEEDVKRIGMRIKSARALTGFNQSEFCEKYGISVGAFKTWESGKFAPRMSNLQDLCSCFEREGVFNVTTSWFLKGEGPAPTHVNTMGIVENGISKVEDQSDIKKEIEFFKKNQLVRQENAIVAMVADDLMAPQFCRGDIVGGVKIANIPSLVDLHNKPFLIEAKPNQYLVRWCFSDGNDLFFKSNNDALLCRVDSNRLGKILWYRRPE